MKKPNFFIVGAHKCGTTALSEYLRTHPNIFITTPKEPHFLATDFSKASSVKTYEEYLELFENSSEKEYVAGEASTWYLYSSEALKNIYRINKNTKIIVMLRNPVDMIYSSHSQLCYSYDEDEYNFEKAWRLQPLRAKGLHIPERCRIPEALQYSKTGKFNTQIERLLNIFPRNQVKIIIFDDFISSTKEIYENVLDFLNVSSDGRTEFPPINVNKVHLNRSLAKFLRFTPKYIYNIKENIKNYTDLRSLGISNFLNSFNRKEISRMPLKPEFKKELINEFREDINKLSRLIKRDLSHWMK